MIFPDGRTDPEKLKEILGNPEETHLDLKAKVDLNDPEDRLKFVKDSVTMSQRPPGGYILIGVDDAGNPCMPIGTIQDRARFDGSRVQALIRGYIEGEVHVLVQIHEVNGNEIVMVYVQQNRDGFPVPFNKDGQYQGPDGKTATVFRKGEIFVREGAENVPIRYAHWQDILSAYADKIRSDAESTAQNLLNEVIAARQQQAAGTAMGVPLLMEMDEATFAAAAVSLLESGNDVRLRQFIRSLSGKAGPGAGLVEFTAALDKWTIFCAQALYFDRSDLVDEAIEKLCDAYKKLGTDDISVRKQFAVVVRIYAIGSLVVRLEAWETVRSLALRPVPSGAQHPDYIYSSWIRHATVSVARANFDVETGEPGNTRAGFVLSAARDLMADHPTMRPDLTDEQIPTDEVGNFDAALNSLCEFDLAYCFIVAAMGKDHGSAYPSSMAFDEDRAKPMAQRIVADADVRQRMFPGVPDADIAAAIADMYMIAIRESASGYGGRWWGMPPSVNTWVNENRSPQ